MRMSSNIRFRSMPRGLLTAWAWMSVAAVSAQAPYAQKPGWWDEIHPKVALESRGSVEEAFRATLGKGRDAFKLEWKEWLLLGPFPASNGLATELPPDDLRGFDPDARFEGAGGDMIGWRRRSQLERDPQRNNSIFYLTTALDTPSATPAWLVFTHREGAEFYLGTERIHRSNRMIAANNEVTREIDLREGRNLFTVKVHQARHNWSVNIDHYRVNPYWIEIAALTRVVTHPPYRDMQGRTDLLERLSDRYDDIEDIDNALHWHAQRFPLLDDDGKTELLSRLVSQAEDNPEVARKVEGLFEQLLRLRETPELMFAYLQLLDNLGETTRLRDRLTGMLPSLRAEDAVEANLWLMHLHLLENDPASARQVAALIQEEDQTGPQRQRFRAMERQLTSMRVSEVQIARDWNFDTTIRQARLLATQDPEALPAFIRGILRENSGLLVSTPDAALFLGGLVAYREAFAEHRDLYEPDLQTFLSLLDNQRRLSPLKRARARQQLSLRPATLSLEIPTSSTPPPDAFPLPRTEEVHPALELSADSRTNRMETDIFTNRVQPVAPAAIVTRGNLTLLQNSRTVALKRENELLWRRDWANARMRFGDSITPWHHELTPALVGDQAVARILLNGLYHLMAMDVETGELQWSWRPEGGVICTNPLIWGEDVVIVTRTTGQISRYDLVFLNRSTGEVETQIVLASTTHTQGLGPLSVEVEMDHYMPDPAVSGNTLFLQTQNGVLASVDLLTRSFRWLRTYNPGNWNQDNALRDLSGRRFTSPLVFGNVVVFSPFDGFSLISVEADTGRLLSDQRAFMGWDVRPFGQYLMTLDAEGAAHILQPETFEPVRSLPGTGYRFITALRDGAVLQNGNELQVWNSTRGVVGRQRFPEGTLPLAVSGERSYFFRPGNSKPMVYSSRPSSASVAEAPRTVPDELQPRSGHFQAGTEGMYLVTEDSVFRFTNPSAPDWAVPHGHRGDPGDLRVFESGDFLYIAEDHGVQILRHRSGEAVRRYPGLGEPRRRLHAPMLSGDTVYAATRSSDTIEVLAFRGDNPPKGVSSGAANEGVPIQIVDEGRLVHVVQGGNVRRLRVREDGDRLERVTQHSSNWSNMSERVTRFGDNQMAWLSPGDIRMLDAEGDWIHSRIHRLRARGGPRIDWRVWSDPLVSWRSRLDQNHVFNSDTQTDLTRTFNIHTHPIAHGGKGYGYAINRGGRVTLREVDLQSDEVKSHPPVRVVDERRDWNRLHDILFSVGHQDKIYTFFNVDNSTGGRGDVPTLILDTRNGEQVRKGFPFTGGLRDAQVWKDTLWLALNQGYLALTMKEVNQLMERPPLLQNTTSLPEDLRLDGFPLEWSGWEFPEAGNGRLTASWDGQRLVLAGRIQNQDFIRRLGRNGMDERVRLHLAHGPQANFQLSNVETLSLRELGDGIEFAYSVPPTGEELFFELGISPGRLREMRLDWDRLRRYPDREVFGDIAFDFSIDSHTGTPVYAFATRPWPVWFPRVLLETNRD